MDMVAYDWLSNVQQPQVKNLKTIWKQVPKVSGQGHYAHRLLFGQDGKLMDLLG